MMLALACVVGVLLTLGAGAIACRQTDPSPDPRMPPNSPLPKIDRPDDSPEKSTPPPPRSPASDGGSSR
jgi:hypothetical protein